MTSLGPTFQSPKSILHAILLRYTSEKDLENTFKVAAGVLSRISMYMGKEPKSILIVNNRLLQYGLMSNSQCHS